MNYPAIQSNPLWTKNSDVYLKLEKTETQPQIDVDNQILDCVSIYLECFRNHS